MWFTKAFVYDINQRENRCTNTQFNSNYTWNVSTFCLGFASHIPVIPVSRRSWIIFIISLCVSLSLSLHMQFYGSAYTFEYLYILKLCMENSIWYPVLRWEFVQCVATHSFIRNDNVCQRNYVCDGTPFDGMLCSWSAVYWSLNYCVSAFFYSSS